MLQAKAPNLSKTLFIILSVVLFLMMATPQQSANAAFLPPLTVTVDHYNDFADDIPGDGICETASGYCTLRAAIEEINAYNVSNPGTHSIHFNVTIGGFPPIKPDSPLPAITAPIIIDGTTQSGSSCSTTFNDLATLNVVLDGALTSSGANGLTFAAGSNGSYVKGLVIGEFSHGIRLEQDVDLINISCNHIGINDAGDTAFSNAYGVSGAGNNDNIYIGGNSFGQRNVISGNSLTGIAFGGFSNDDMLIQGNFIGTDATGATAVPNGSNGISIDGDDAEIGGSGTAEPNVISGNGDSGIVISKSSQGLIIQNNKIGTDLFGSAALGNGGHGIWIIRGYNNTGTPSDITIGALNNGNIIANNGLAGINIEGDATDNSHNPFDNTLRYNAIYNNGGLGIDLAFSAFGDGVTANDGTSDPDNGPNTLLNHPNLSGAITDGTTVTVTLDYVGVAGSYELDFYLNDSCDPSGYGEGQNFSHTYSFTKAGGVYNQTLNFASTGSAGKYLTAVANLDSNSSEFSQCAYIADITTFVINSAGNASDYSIADNRCDTDNNPANGDNCTLRAAIEQVNGFGSGVGPVTINFNIPGGGVHVIQPTGSALPAITHPILLDATTQPDASCPTATEYQKLFVQLDGAALGAVNGLTLNAGSDGSLIKGFS